MEISLKNRHSKLREVILCYPVNYKVENKEINRELMFRQYNKFINILSKQGVKNYFLEPNFGISQVYTRDIAFVIDDILFFSKVKGASRKEEYKALEEFLKDEKIKVKTMKNFIEGGDIILHNNIIFIGQSKRTSIEAIRELDKILRESKKNFEIIPINFDNEEVVHLDCAFNVISKDCCVITDYVYDVDIIKKYFKKIYYIERHEAKKLAANFLAIDENTIISSSQKLCEILSKDGIDTIYIDYSEVIKGGGGFTCTTLPILCE